MSWRDEPATQSQLITLRDLYWKASSYEKAQAAIQMLKIVGITKGKASDEIFRLQQKQANGTLYGSGIEDVKRMTQGQLFRTNEN